MGPHVDTIQNMASVKEQHLYKAGNIFGESGMNLATDGRPYLGSAIGSPEYVNEILWYQV